MTFSPTPQDIQTMFDRIAPVYDSMNDWLSLGLHRVWKLMAIKWLNPQKHKTYLDLCCGTGDLTFLLAKQLSQGKVIGVDFSSELLNVAKTKATEKSYTCDINWLQADVLDLPFDNNSIDGITMGYGLRNLTDIPRGLKEIHRVLKPDGKSAILDFHLPDNSWVAQSQKWYLDNVVVTFAQWLGSKEDYAYIYPSLVNFPNGEKQREISRQSGFTDAVHYPLFGGMMGILVLTK